MIIALMIWVLIIYTIILGIFISKYVNLVNDYRKSINVVKNKLYSLSTSIMLVEKFIPVEKNYLKENKDKNDKYEVNGNLLRLIFDTDELIMNNIIEIEKILENINSNKK